MTDDRDVLALLNIERDVLEHVWFDVTAFEGLVDVVDLAIGDHELLLQLAAVPRVTIDAAAATILSRTKPTRPT